MILDALNLIFVRDGGKGIGPFDMLSIAMMIDFNISCEIDLLKLNNIRQLGPLFIVRV